MSKIKKRIVIHTGPGKTGSSAIQAWLIAEVDFLSSQGVFYPKYKLSKENISSGNRDQILSQQANGFWKLDIQKTEKLLNDFEVSNYSTLLLSSEFFFMHIIEISRVIPNAEFVAYIRNPVELLESNYNQSIKRHSRMQKFIPPQKLESNLWGYLQNVFKNVDPSLIHLRAYDKSLMVRGNIISDLLSMLDLEAEIEDKRINPSFTFGALEFKRLCNFFELGALDPQLDAVLQGCSIGTHRYSLMHMDTFNALNEASCLQMKSFIETHQQAHLKSLLDVFEAGKQRVYIEQVADVNILKPIAEYVKKTNEGLYKKLSILLQNNTNLVIDNPIIYNVFDIEAQPLDRASLVDRHLSKHIKKFTVQQSKREKICYEMSCYFDEMDNFEYSLSFAKAAYFYNSENFTYVQHLNKLLIVSNQLNNKIDNTKEKQTRLKKIKQRFFSI